MRALPGTPGNELPKRGILASAALTIALTVAVALGTLGACGGSLAPSTADAGDDTDAADPRRWSFDPTKYSGTCNTDSDCALRPVITDCLVCCTNRGAIRADVSELDFGSVLDACREPGAPAPRGTCSADCATAVTCRQNDCAVVKNPPPPSDAGR